MSVLDMGFNSNPDKKSDYKPLFIDENPSEKSSTEYQPLFSDTPNDTYGSINEFGTQAIPTGGFEALRRQRAENQSTGEQIGRTLGNLAPNIGLGLLEQAGYMAELAIDKEGDYSNALTEWAKEKRNPFGETYRENPEKVFDMVDPAWWLENGGGLAESIGEFAITGAGIGSALGKGSKALSSLIKAKGYLDKGINAVGALSTSTTLGYLESAAMSSELYKRAIAEGKTPEQAAKGASDLMKWNIPLLALTNLSSIAPMFKKAKSIARADELGLGRVVGESLEGRVGRIKNYIDDLKVSDPKKAQYLVQEGLMESLEEELNIFSERRGEIGAELRKDESLTDSFIDGVFTQEGLLSGMLGFAGGAGQSGIIKYAPRPYIKDDGGIGLKESLDKEQRIQEEVSKREYASSLANFLNTQVELNRNLKDAARVGDVKSVDKIKNQIFNNYTQHALSKDTLEGIQQSMEEIEKLSNDDPSIPIEKEITEISQNLNQLNEQLKNATDDESLVQLTSQIEELNLQREQKQEESKNVKGKSEAVLAGYADSIEDNEYKTIASEKKSQMIEYIQKLKEYQKKYENTSESEQFELGREATKRYINFSTAEKQYQSELEYIDNTLLAPYLRDQVTERASSNLKTPTKAKLKALSLFNDDNPEVQKFVNEKRKLLEEELKSIEELEPRKKVNKQDQTFIDDSIIDFQEFYRSEFFKEQAEKEFNDFQSDKGRSSFISKRKAELKNQVDEIRNTNKQRVINSSKKKSSVAETYNKVKNKIKENLTSEEDVLATDLIEDDLINDEVDLDETSQSIESLLSKAVEAEQIKKEEEKALKKVQQPVSKPSKEDVDELGDMNVLGDDLGDDLQIANSQTLESLISNKSEDEDVRIKIINAANSLALPSPKQYETLSEEEGILNTTNNKISKDYPTIMMSGDLKIGDELRFEEDLNYNQDGQTYESLRKKEDNGYFGLFRPIAVYRGNDFLHYLHDINYITPKRVNETIEINGEILDNIEIQKGLLSKLRLDIVNNGGKHQGIIKNFSGETVVSLRPSIGKKIPSVSSKNVFENKILEFGVIKNGQIISGDRIITTSNSESFFDQERQGSPVVILPKSNSNIPLAFPLEVNKTNYSDTIYKVIESYLTESLENVEDFKNKGYDIKDRDSVRNLLSSFVYLDNSLAKPDLKRSIEILENPISGKYYMAIVDGKIYIQSTDKNGKTAARVEINAENFQEKSELLKGHINKMPTNFNEENFSKPIEIVYLDKNKVKSKIYTDYREFVKENTNTVVQENKFKHNGEEKYSYFDNPNIQFELTNPVEEIQIAKKQEVEKEVDELTENKTIETTIKPERKALPKRLKLGLNPNSPKEDKSPIVQKHVLLRISEPFPLLKDNSLVPFIPKENEALYKEYNLLANDGKVKEVFYKTDKQKITARKWLLTLNKSPYYTFDLKNVSGKYKIFIYPKKELNLSYMQSLIDTPIDQKEIDNLFGEYLTLQEKAQLISNNESENRRKQCL